jgi:hypothetical protein
MSEYAELKKRLASGWNTWNTRSVLSHVLLPEGFALNLGLKDFSTGGHLRETLIGRKDPAAEQARPGPRAYDGGHTTLNVKWRGIDVDVQSAKDGDDLVILVTPNSRHRRTPLLIVETGMVWNRPGKIEIAEGVIRAVTPTRVVEVRSTAESVNEPNVQSLTPYLALPLDGPVGLSEGRERSLEEITGVVEKRRAERVSAGGQYGDLSDVCNALQTCMAWDTIYDPSKDRVISPVSRIWNTGWGGYVLFCWDTYFAACMASIDNKDLAFANAIEITREKVPGGFVPNFGGAHGSSSHDRSQPPVGSMMAREIHRRHPERWFLEEVFDDLLEWNRWWAKARDNGGFLSRGSNPFEPLVDAGWELNAVNDRQGAAYESGLDNSPMYDDIPFNEKTHMLELADVGLMGLYLGDCEALSEIADTLGRPSEAAEVRARARGYSAKLAELWDDDFGLFLNKRTDTGDFSRRISPTNFYPMLGRVPTQAQAERMVNAHMLNPDEFWGEWVLPSISRNDPGYPDNDYWRGRIWAPMNFLVYLGLRNYELPEARTRLAERSKALLMKSWLEEGHVYENYNADTGEGSDVHNADRFYHWGALLGLIALMEAGRVDAPEE